MHAARAARQDDGRTALFWAARNGHMDIARLLLERGADVNHAEDVSADGHVHQRPTYPFDLPTLKLLP